MALTMRHKAAKILAHHAMPRRPKQPVKLLFDIHGNVLFDIEFDHGGRGDVDCLALHVIRHYLVLASPLSLWVCSTAC